MARTSLPRSPDSVPSRGQGIEKPEQLERLLRAKNWNGQPVDCDFSFRARPAAARELFIFLRPGGGTFQKSTVLEMDFFEGGRPEIPLKRRATDTSETWGVKKRLKFKKAPFSTHPTFPDFCPIH